MSQEALKSIDIHLMFSSLKIEEISSRINEQDSQAENPPAIRIYRLTSSVPFVNPREFLAAIFRDWRSLVRCISLLVRLYIVVKVCILSEIQFNFDKVRDQIWSTGSNKLGHEPKCINSTYVTTIKSSNELFRLSIELEDWLFYLGSLSRTFRGVVSIGYLIAASSSVCFDFLGAAVIHFRKPRVDVYGFVKDKQAERRKFTIKMKSLVDDLFVCREQFDAGGLVYKYTPKGNLFIVRDHYRLAPSKTGTDALKLAEAENSSCLSIRGNKKLHQLIDPAHLKDSWHRKLSLGSSMLTQLGFITCFGFGFLFLTATTILDVMRRLWYRLALFDCFRQDKTLSPQYLTPLRLRDLETKSQFEAYNNLDGSLVNFLRLFLIEFKLFYGWREISTFIQIVHILVFGSFTITLYVGIYVALYGSKTLWLNQIRSQVRHCLANLMKSVNTIGIRNSDEANKQCRYQNNNMKLLTLAYLNFELFRREQGAYRSLTNFLITQMTLMNVPMLIITYLTLPGLRSDAKFIAFCLTCHIFSILNVYLITSAIRTNMALKLMRDLSRLVAYMAENSLERTPVARLWSLQILNYSETLNCFGPKLFGIPISFDRVVTLNAYLMTFWICALRF